MSDNQVSPAQPRNSIVIESWQVDQPGNNAKVWLANIKIGRQEAMFAGKAGEPQYALLEPMLKVEAPNLLFLDEWTKLFVAEVQLHFPAGSDLTWAHEFARPNHPCLQHHPRKVARLAVAERIPGFVPALEEIPEVRAQPEVFNIWSAKGLSVPQKMWQVGLQYVKAASYLYTGTEHRPNYSLILQVQIVGVLGLEILLKALYYYEFKRDFKIRKKDQREFHSHDFYELYLCFNDEVKERMALCFDEQMARMNPEELRVFNEYRAQERGKVPGTFPELLQHWKGMFVDARYYFAELKETAEMVFLNELTNGVIEYVKRYRPALAAPEVDHEFQAMMDWGKAYSDKLSKMIRAELDAHTLDQMYKEWPNRRHEDPLEAALKDFEAMNKQA